MLLRRNESGERDAISTIRDIVEIVAIIAAGCWAFYVFAYENRIKPSFAAPDINVSASMQKLSQRNGLIGIDLRVEYRNTGTVQARFLASVINVYGQRITGRKPRPHTSIGIDYDGSDFSQAGSPVAVYTWAYVTGQGDPSSHHESTLDPGSSIANDRIFYVPVGRFDLLTLGVDAPYTKYQDVMPASLIFQPDGGVTVKLKTTPRMQQFNIKTVTSLDIR